MVAGLVYDIPTVAELIDRIIRQAEALIRGRLTGFLGERAALAETMVA
jgi:nitronate monooxygenase